MANVAYICASCTRQKVCKFQEEFQKLHDKGEGFKEINLPEFLTIACKHYTQTN